MTRCNLHAMRYHRINNLGKAAEQSGVIANTPNELLHAPEGAVIDAPVSGWEDVDANLR